MSRLFDRYDAADLTRLFEVAGVLEVLRGRGFADFAVDLAATGSAPPHILLSAGKDGRRHLLLDACLRRIAVALPRLGAAPLDVVLVHWVREGDPTAAFTPARPRLLLQTAPGLGVLRRAFRIAVQIAADLGADAVASQPKFFHDAVIFRRTRLFLFLDGREQGWFEALERDLAALPLREASIAVAAWCVRDADGAAVHWAPGYQAYPVSARLADYFNSAAYAETVAAARAAGRFAIDPGALAAAAASLDAAA